MRFHPEYQKFLTVEKIAELQAIFEHIEKENYTPDEALVLRFLQIDPRSIKIVILGQDPYHSVVDGKKVANGRGFQPANLISWLTSFRQVSLKNIIRNIYYSEYQELKKFSEIQKEIAYGRIPLLPPNEWFDSLEKQGALFLNTAFTTRIHEANAHQELWKNFTLSLIQFYQQYDYIWFLWGKNAASYQEEIIGKKYISRHPMMCNPKIEDDFLNNPCFKETKQLINWWGE
ncbi:MAG: hypothetical protein R3Y57_02840 [Erysipelotrichaceae bacterium]